MEVPANVKTLQTDTSILWFDKEGILCSVPVEGAVPDYSKEAIDRNMKLIREFIGDRKVCFLSLSNPNSKTPNREERDRVADAINSITKAMAIVTTSPVSKMIANLFFGFKPPPYPAKMFTNEKDAREWIRQYL